VQEERAHSTRERYCIITQLIDPRLEYVSSHLQLATLASDTKKHPNRRTRQFFIRSRIFPHFTYNPHCAALAGGEAKAPNLPSTATNPVLAYSIFFRFRAYPKVTPGTSAPGALQTPTPHQDSPSTSEQALPPDPTLPLLFP